MKVLIISPSFPPAREGEAEHGFQIADRLARQGCTVTVLTDVREDVVRPSNVEVWATMTGWGWRDLYRLARAVVRAAPDGALLVYTAWLFERHPMITFLPTLLARLRPSSRLLTLFEILQAPEIEHRSTRIGRKLASMVAGGTGVDYDYGTLLRDSHGVVALGPSILMPLLARQPAIADRGWLLPPPPLVPTDRVREGATRSTSRARLGLADSTFVLAFFGYVYPGKGVETLLQALSRLHKSGRDVALLMVGGGRGETTTSPGDDRHAEFGERLRQQSRDLGLDGRVHWLAGYASGADGPAEDLLAADAAALPFDDGVELRRSSVAVVAAAGLPIITTQPSADETAFIDQLNVYLCPPEQADALAAAIVDVMDDAPLRQRLQSGALSLAHDWFSWDGAISKIQQALSPAGASTAKPVIPGTVYPIRKD
jgi:polysaccharide biosynthesis protein PslF